MSIATASQGQVESGLHLILIHVLYVVPMGPPESLQKRHFDRFINFCGLTVVSNRRTDHGTYGDNRPHLITAYIAMPPNSNNHVTITGLVTDTDVGGVYVLRST